MPFDTFVTSTFPDSPAFRAGLRFGDKIVAVNGEKVFGKTSAFVRDKVRGKKGTIVRLNGRTRRHVKDRNRRNPPQSRAAAFDSRRLSSAAEHRLH